MSEKFTSAADVAKQKVSKPLNYRRMPDAGMGFACAPFKNGIFKKTKGGVAMGNNNNWGMTGAISRWLLASVLFLLVMLGWLGDSLISVLIGRPLLTFHEVYRSWKDHLLHSRLSAK